LKTFQHEEYDEHKANAFDIDRHVATESGSAVPDIARST